MYSWTPLPTSVLADSIARGLWPAGVLARRRRRWPRGRPGSWPRKPPNGHVPRSTCRVKSWKRPAGAAVICQDFTRRAPRSAQALAGLRDIVTFAGFGPSSLPGGLGAIARRGQAALFRALERAGQRLADVPLVERVMQDVSSMGTGIRRVFRERIRE